MLGLTTSVWFRIIRCRLLVCIQNGISCEIVCAILWSLWRFERYCEKSIFIEYCSDFAIVLCAVLMCTLNVAALYHRQKSNQAQMSGEFVGSVTIDSLVRAVLCRLLTNLFSQNEFNRPWTKNNLSIWRELRLSFKLWYGRAGWKQHRIFQKRRMLCINLPWYQHCGTDIRFYFFHVFHDFLQYEVCIWGMLG